MLYDRFKYFSSTLSPQDVNHLLGKGSSLSASLKTAGYSKSSIINDITPLVGPVDGEVQARSTLTGPSLKKNPAIQMTGSAAFPLPPPFPSLSFLSQTFYRAQQMGTAPYCTTVCLRGGEPLGGEGPTHAQTGRAAFFALGELFRY
ncbi:hypothetical protein M406DRAFT_353703 [Cryphonectria parasitica EP155]|uniref:Uncharacterized protein n=1 Tax=Cryphonectria parasitica (strain ATCC 38755 / EP155) TaxID=660469 RepID=A0A9P4XUQ6_CRYP1|nr:uncharacterized protein M406DRAFT_353703 [Cryphonectria parasitica EP155]KAF3761095.1 hypothetical protein M406DRAFT_353703 [Cryphonectria parasitica EP155]